ncbi:RICIN domain-containing protein [Nonomuraea sp. NBC_01738]|uniref:RICIN domain-containing protein n=1 Tax=Nonomuraea sp. NBC_01738 TaxID=2976003 RepID=UPI002E1078AC|nr:RICIN domain-containing protein [Nonomuraea sp. NBC_01738]
MRRALACSALGLVAAAGLFNAAPAQAAVNPVKVIDGIIKLTDNIINAVQKAQRNGKAKDDRSAFVQQLLLDLRDDTKGQYNILICSVQAACDVRIEGGNDNVDYKDSVRYDSPVDDGGKKPDPEFADTEFRIWVFDDAAKVNTNGQYGWHNWGMWGALKPGLPKGHAEFGRTPTFEAHEAFDRCDTNDDGDKSDLGECDGNAAPAPRGSAPAHGKSFTFTADNGTVIAGRMTTWDKGGNQWQLEESNGANTGKTSQVYPDRGWGVNWGPANGGDTKQRWNFEPAGDGWYRIRNVYNQQHGYPQGGCLTAQGGDGFSFHAWNCDRGRGGGQLWKLS